MRNSCLVALALILTVAGRAPAQTQFKSVEAVTIKGAYGLVVVPEHWNGGLVLYAHGYSADKRLLKPFPEDLTPTNFLQKLDTLFVATLLPTTDGYAVATTTFGSVGWYVKDSIKDIENLRRYFVKKYGRPKHTYLWGHSGGGMVTAAVAEYFPRTYDGVAPMCGPVAGARRNFNGAFDLRAVFESVCRNVPDARFACGVCSDGQSRCVVDADCAAGQTCSGRETPGAPEVGLSAECTDFLLAHPEHFSESTSGSGGDFLTGPVTACFGSLDNVSAPTADQAARRDLFVRATQIPEHFIGIDMFFATIGMGEVVHRRTGGRHPWGNDGVTYTPPALSGDELATLNATVPRVQADAAAVKYMRRYYEPRAATHAKVITLHALDDGLVIPENEDKYREAFEAAGRSDQLVQLQTAMGGHCGGDPGTFVFAIIPAVRALEAWVEKGQKPTFAAVQAACGNCLTPITPGAWGSKVVERRQKGAPLHSLVCMNEPGDCPVDATCVAERKRCE